MDACSVYIYFVILCLLVFEDQQWCNPALASCQLGSWFSAVIFPCCNPLHAELAIAAGPRLQGPCLLIICLNCQALLTTAFEVMHQFIVENSFLLRGIAPWVPGNTSLLSVWRQTRGKTGKEKNKKQCWDSKRESSISELWKKEPFRLEPSVVFACSEVFGLDPRATWGRGTIGRGLLLALLVQQKMPLASRVLKTSDLCHAF